MNKAQKSLQTILFGHWKTIKAKFLHAFLDIVVAALAILLAAMLTFFWLRENALILAEKRGPMALAASSLVGGLQTSLANMRGWLSVPDAKFLDEYRQTWKDKIWHNYDALYQLAKKYNDRSVLKNLDNTKLILINLYNTQQQILDIAHTVGNNKALTQIYLNLQPVMRDLLGLINGLKNIQSQQTATGSYQGLRLLDRFENKLALSLKALQSYSMYGLNDDYISFNLNLAEAGKAFEDYKHWQKRIDFNSWEQREKELVLSSVNLELKAFSSIANQTASLVQSKQTDVARQKQKQLAIPLEQEIAKLLQSIMEAQQSAMVSNTKQLTWIGQITPWVMTILVMSLLLIAILLAFLASTILVKPIRNLSLATKKLASHELEEDIPVPSEDELGQLTISFNQMRASLQASQEQTEQLLLNILPRSIVKRLRDGEKVIADKFEDVSILFLDIVGFTTLATKLKPEKLVNILGHLFTRFDALLVKYHLEKIKTIGDAYMVAGGVPEPDANHLKHMIDFSLATLSIMPEFNEKHQTDLHIRMGLHCGEVIAGILGQKRFSYDLWGDTVNLASRMESHGLEDHLQVTEDVYQRMKHDYDFTPRGKISIKGVPEDQPVYLLS